MCVSMLNYSRHITGRLFVMCVSKCFYNKQSQEASLLCITIIMCILRTGAFQIAKVEKAFCVVVLGHYLTAL